MLTMYGNRSARMDKLSGQCRICQFSEWAVHFLDDPSCILIIVQMLFMESIRIHSRLTGPVVADTQQQTSLRNVSQAIEHCLSIMSTWSCQSKLMMRMPFSDMLERILFHQFVSYRIKVLYILIEKGAFMIGIRSRTYCIKNHRGSLACPEAEQLTTGFNVRIIKDTSGNIIQLASIDKCHRRWSFFIHQLRS